MIQLASAVIEIPQKSDVVTFSAFQKMSKKPNKLNLLWFLPAGVVAQQRGYSYCLFQI